MPGSIPLSVVIPVSERQDEVRELYGEYAAALAQVGMQYEVLFVLDGEFPDTLRVLQELQTKDDRISIIRLTQSFGEAAALSAAFAQTNGDLILTLPAYSQVAASELPEFVKSLGSSDMISGQRWPRIDPWSNRLQSKIFHGLLNFVSGYSFKDLGCSVRLLRKEVAEEIDLYGDQHRFLPVLASNNGFSTKEIQLSQSVNDASPRVYRPGIYLRRVLDILTVFFLVKFTKKPLRFFGLIGSAVFAVGGVLLAYLIYERLFGGHALADRPALMLSSLLIVLGVQMFALGLIGELVIFTHARDMKEYKVDKIIN